MLYANYSPTFDTTYVAARIIPLQGQGNFLSWNGFPAEVRGIRNKNIHINYQLLVLNLNYISTQHAQAWQKKKKKKIITCTNKFQNNVYIFCILSNSKLQLFTKFYDKQRNTTLVSKNTPLASYRDISECVLLYMLILVLVKFSRPFKVFYD
jgi:hypothetical protein